MDKRVDDIVQALGTHHPARPYLIIGGLVGGLGLMRNSLSGLVLLGLGGALIARGMEEIRNTVDLHDGNHHGVNGPPANV